MRRDRHIVLLVAVVAVALSACQGSDRPSDPLPASSVVASAEDVERLVSEWANTVESFTVSADLVAAV